MTILTTKNNQILLLLGSIGKFVLINDVLQQERRLPWQPGFAANRAMTAERMDETTMLFRKFPQKKLRYGLSLMGLNCHIGNLNVSNQDAPFFLSIILLQVAYQGYFVSYQSNLLILDKTQVINTRHVEFSVEWGCTIIRYT